MITNSKQNWEVGQQIKVGFLTLRVTGTKKNDYHGMPDIYELESLNSEKKYEFTPHNGLRKA